MRFFPSILPGSTVQYPAKRRRFQRTIENVTPGGGRFRSVDTGDGSLQWELSFPDISSEQRLQLDELFEECKGRLLPFVFLDPFQNLVRHSEAFEQSVWEKDANIVVVGSQSDPLGSSRARRLSNASGIAGSVLQRLTTPAWFTYTVSCWLRANVPTTVEVLAHPATSGPGQAVIVTPAWQRYSIRIQHASNEEVFHTGLRLPGNSEIYAFGFQIEQFSIVSDYKSTDEESGVHANSRFENDEIRWITNGVDHHTTRIVIQSPIMP